MATFAVTHDNARVNDADVSTNWGNIGGGGGVAAEPDIVYQGSASQSRKVSTTLRGRDYDPGSGGVDMTATDRKHWMAKVSVTNPLALLTRTSPALHVRIGDSSSTTYDYYVAGSDNYRPLAGWLIFAIDPAVSGYRDATNGGGPSALTAIDYFGVLGDFSTGSKADNLVIDAIDIGAGLVGTGGDGASTDGTWQDFVAYDYSGATPYRAGYVVEFEGVIYPLGLVALGEDTSGSAVATGFTGEPGITVVWRNSYCSTGFNRLRVNLGGTGTAVVLPSGDLKSRGEVNNTLGLGYSTSEDTRTELVVTGTTGTLTCGMNLQNFRSIDLDGGCTWSDAVWRDCGQITLANSPTLSGITIIDPTDDGALLVQSTSDLDNVSDVAFDGAGVGGTSVDAAIEVDISGAGPFTLDLESITFSNRVSGSVDIHILANGNADYTINVNGGDTPTVTNDGSGSVTVNNPKTFTVAGLIAGSEVRVFRTSDDTELGGIESSGTSFDYDYNYTVDTPIYVVIMNTGYLWLRYNDTLENSDKAINANQRVDRDYLNP